MKLDQVFIIDYLLKYLRDYIMVRLMKSMSYNFCPPNNAREMIWKYSAFTIISL